MRALPWLLVLVFFLVSCSPPSQETNPIQMTPVADMPEGEEDLYVNARNQLVEEIKGQGVVDADILSVMASVPRHKFVPSKYLDQAYENHPLPIGYGQTISQPYIVAWMTDLIELQPGEKVLEIGTGSGYQTAVLAELGDVEIYSIEIVPELAESAAARLKDMGYTNIHTKQGDGYYGWSEYAPFDAIIVTAAPDHLPTPLVAQLTEDGRIVIPIGPPGWIQSLWKFVQQDGELIAYNLGGVSFVPLTGLGVEEHERAATANP